MNYRTLDSNSDYQLGQFLTDSSAAVGQAVYTRLLLWTNEWFLDLGDGTPYATLIMGFGTNYDFEIKQRILQTPGVLEIESYYSSISPLRRLTVTATIDTIYGTTTVTL